MNFKTSKYKITQNPHNDIFIKIPFRIHLALISIFIIRTSPRKNALQFNLL
jgi:hypothetical protein